MYGKLFASTFTGSMVGAGANVFALWSYVVANTRSDGYVELNPPIIAAMIGCSPQEVVKAIDYLTSPDPISRSKKHDGRRLIQEAAFLYLVPNYPDYRAIRDDRDRREYMKNYMREYRANERAGKDVNNLRKLGKSRLAQAEAEAEAEAESKRGEVAETAPRAPQVKIVATRIPDPFPITPEMWAWLAENKIELDNVQLAHDEWVEYWTNCTTAKAVKPRWDLAWRKGMKKAAQWQAERKANGNNKKTNFGQRGGRGDSDQTTDDYLRSIGSRPAL